MKCIRCGSSNITTTWVEMQDDIETAFVICRDCYKAVPDPRYLSGQRQILIDKKKERKAM